MYMSHQHLLFISLNLLSSKGSYTISGIYYNLYQIYNISPFLIRRNVFGYRKFNVEVLRQTLHKGTSALNREYFSHYICSYIICTS